MASLYKSAYYHGNPISYTMKSRVQLLKNISLNSIFIILLFCQPLFVQAQEEMDSFPLTKKNTVYLELGGNGLWYSLNYDRFLWKRSKSAIAARIGVAYFGGQGAHATTVPVTVSYLFGGKKHFLEVGTGFTWLQSYSEKIAGFGYFGVIGYRFQRIQQSGLMYRISLTPFLAEYSTDKGSLNWVGTFWGGVSIGYGF